MNYCSWQDFFTDGNGTHAYNNDNVQRLRDFEDAWTATVFGIQGNIGDYCFSDIIEFKHTGVWKGTILTIGSAGYQWSSSNGGERDNVKTLTANSLTYLLNASPATGVDNTNANAVKAAKEIRNGQVVIIRDNKTYNVLGTRVE